MVRATFRYCAQLLIALSPLLTLQWSLLDWWGYNTSPDGRITPAGFAFIHIPGPKDKAELQVALILTMLAVTLTSLTEFLDVARPREDLRQFRSEYLDQQRKTWTRGLGQNVRMNVMYSYRPWYVLFAAQRLRWVWGWGFRPPHWHHDAELSFWSGQGVCGRAFARKRPVFADLRAFRPSGIRRLLMNAFWLGPSRLRRTEHVKAVLSVPLFVQRGLKWHCVGVINVDALDDASAALLETNQERLIEYFSEVGKLVARLRY